MNFDPVAFGKGVGVYIRETVSDALRAITPRLEALEAKETLTVAEFREAIAALPTPKDGEDGKSVSADDVLPALREELQLAVNALPKPQDGKSVTAEEVLPPLIEELRAAIATLPVPENGKDGQDGKSVTLDEVAPLLEQIVVKWALDFERRAQDVLQRAIDRMPPPKDGKDGFSLDDLTMTDDGEGNVTLRFERGELVKEHTFNVPGFRDKGVYTEGKVYAKGDSVTWGGSAWFAQKATDEKPGTGDGWRLAVKKGRDGKDGEKGLPGNNGRDGLDWPQVKRGDK